MHYNFDILTDYIHGELAPGEDARVYDHLSTCNDCRHAYETELSLGETLRNSSLAQDRELPPMLKAQIWAAIRTQRPAALETLRSFLRPAYALPVVAAVLIAGYFGVPAARTGLTPHAEPGMTAMYYLDVHEAASQSNPLADRQLRINAAEERPSSTPVAEIPATIAVASESD